MRKCNFDFCKFNAYNLSYKKSEIGQKNRNTWPINTGTVPTTQEWEKTNMIRYGYAWLVLNAERKGLQLLQLQQAIYETQTLLNWVASDLT